MLVSKIKPCMSKYKQLYCETANGSNKAVFIAIILGKFWLKLWG
jgi:hypothetical protein